jgi:hypothetical protein
VGGLRLELCTELLESVVSRVRRGPAAAGGAVDVRTASAAATARWSASSSYSRSSWCKHTCQVWLAAVQAVCTCCP